MAWRRFPLAALLLVVAACAGQPPPAPKPIPGGTVFNQALAGAGTWDEIPGVGTVWRPSVGVVGIGFVPYVSSGHWAWSEDGWVFLSDYPWGWATFHYGRWFYQSTYGWMWAPGQTWAASWVDWRYGHGYVAWMPSAPLRSAGKEKWHVVETRYFTGRDLMPRGIGETPVITAALRKPEVDPKADPPIEISPFPPKDTVAQALGRAVPEPTAQEARKESTGRNAFPRPKPAAPATAAVAKAETPAGAKPAIAEQTVLAQATPLPKMAVADDPPPRSHPASPASTSHATKHKKKKPHRH